MENKLFKFYGKFRELIPAGWEFQKLFARNYRQYSICPAGKWVDTIRVWQHLGGYVEINDFFGNSEDVVKYYVNGGTEMPVLNRKTGEIESYDRSKHNSITLMCEMESKGAAEQDIRDAMKKFGETWKEVHLNAQTIAYLKKMIEWGWIKI